MALENYLIHVLSHVHSIDMCLLQPDLLYSPSLAVHLHIRTVFCSGCGWLCCRYGPGGIAAPADFPSYHPVDERAFMTLFIHYTKRLHITLAHGYLVILWPHDEAGTSHDIITLLQDPHAITHTLVTLF